MTESLPDQPEKTYEFEDWCMETMQSGPVREEMLGGAPEELQRCHVRQVVEQVWMWAGLNELPPCSADGRLSPGSGRNYKSHSQHGKNAVTVHPEADMYVVLHECAHALLRQIGLNSDHSPTFRKLALDLYDTFLPGFELKELEAKAIAKGLGITIDWTFDIEDYT
jgi:hypothetical protein